MVIGLTKTFNNVPLDSQNSMTMIKRINLKLKFVTFYKGGKIKFMKIKKKLKNVHTQIIKINK